MISIDGRFGPEQRFVHLDTPPHLHRAHRIGQTRNVVVYRLISAGTIEEKVMALKARKAELFSSVIDSGNVFGGGLDADDIRALFE